jgi:peroxiredoxin Q/BCP
MANLLAVGAQAPMEIVLEASDGKSYSLADFKGRKTILFFYPKANTPGCTAEAKSLSEAQDELKEMGFNVVGVSPDSVERQCSFIDKQGLTTLLLADIDHKLADGFGAWGLKKNFGKEYMGLIRSTFILDEAGVVTKVFKTVKTKTHGQDILDFVGKQ